MESSQEKTIGNSIMVVWVRISISSIILSLHPKYILFRGSKSQVMQKFWYSTGMILFYYRVGILICDIGGEVKMDRGRRQRKRR